MLFSIFVLILLIIFLLITLFRFSLFTKIHIKRCEINESKVVFRAVKGNFETLQKEQSIYTRRARSLWGKEMNTWPTFRIIYPNNYCFSLFGIIVPDSFDCDPDCLRELGFTLGKLDKIADAARIELPLRSCTALKLNQFRSERSFNSYFKEHPELDFKCTPLAEFRVRKKHKQTFIKPLINPQELTGLWVPN